MRGSTKAFISVIIISSILLVTGLVLTGLYPKSEDRPEVLAKFRDLIGRENYAELTSECKILFIDDNEDDGAYYPKLNQIRIKVSSEKRMLIALCHEYGHFMAVKTNCAEDPKYISLFESGNPVWYGNFDMTDIAYENIDEFCASYIGMWYFNGYEQIK